MLPEELGITHFHVYMDLGGRNRALFRRLWQRIASEMDCLLERDGFELSGDFVNRQEAT